MSDTSSNLPTKSSESLNRYGVNTIIREFFLVIFLAILLFVSAGFLWFNAWIYIIWLLIFSFVFMGVMIYRNPTLLNLRGRPSKAMRSGHMKRYDKVFFAFYTILFILIPITAGVDIGRFMWSIMPFWLVFLGLILTIVGESIFGWAMIVNPFFHGMVKIQEDQGHEVVSKGPYQRVRHPGYLGQILYYLGFPLLLGSWWAFLLGVIMVIAFIYRTAKEDRTLRNELDGYNEYTKQVRKRLFPGFW